MSNEYNPFDPTQPSPAEDVDPWDLDYYYLFFEPGKERRAVGFVDSKTGEGMDKVVAVPEEAEDDQIIDTAEGDEPPSDARLGTGLTWWKEDSAEFFNEKHLAPKYVSKDASGRVVQKFPTATAYLDYVYGECAVPGPQRMSHRADMGRQTLNVSWSEARELAVLGWPEGAERVNKLTQKLHSVLVGLIPVPEVVHQETGEQIDIGRWVEGDPEDFMTMVDGAVTEEKRKPQVVRIVATVDIAMSPESFITRGAGVIAVAQLLEMHGYRVQVDCHIGSNAVVDTWIRLKESDESMNLEKLVFFTAHPVMFWRLSYGAWEMLDEETRRRAGWLGTKSMGWISEPPEDDHGDVYVSAKGSSWMMTEETTMRWVVETLRAQGIEVGE